jgi:hypothetical protein
MSQVSYAPASLPALKPPRPRRNHLALVVGIVIFAAMSTWMAIASKGFLEADACTHYMFARHSLAEPAYLVNVWGRPLCTCLYALPAAIGRVMGVRVMSLLLSITIGLVAYRIARKQGYRMPALAPILLFAQPLFYLHSFSELTEIPFAFVAVLAFWAYQSKNFLAMTLLVAITPSGRPEGFFLIALAALALVCHKRWEYLFLLPVPLLCWSFLGWLSWGSPHEIHWYRWLQVNWPYAAKSAYGSGHWYHFILQLPVLVSPMIFPALPIGILLSIRAGLHKFVWDDGTNRHTAESKVLEYARPQRVSGMGFFADHTARCQFLIAFIPLTILFVHSVLWATGRMASNGELRYLLCVAPLWALLCAQGFEWVWERFRLPIPFIVAGLFATIPIFPNRYYQVVPFKIYAEDYLGRAVAHWYRTTPGLEKDYPRVMASLPAIYFALDLSQSNPQHGETWGQKNAHATHDGVILFWDINALTNASRDMIVTKDEIEAAGWLWIGNIVYEDKWCDVYLSPKTATGAPTDPSRYHPPGDVTPLE